MARATGATLPAERSTETTVGAGDDEGHKTRQSSRASHLTRHERRDVERCLAMERQRRRRQRAATYVESWSRGAPSCSRNCLLDGGNGLVSYCSLSVGRKSPSPAHTNAAIVAYTIVDYTIKYLFLLCCATLSIKDTDVVVCFTVVFECALPSAPR